MTRPFTRTDRILSGMLFACVGAAGGGLLVVFVTEPAWFWIFYGVALVMLVPCGLARLRQRRRMTELDRVTHQRGWQRGAPDIHAFTEADIEEVRHLYGRRLADVIRALGSRPRGGEGT